MKPSWPLQGDVGPVLVVEGDEAAVEPQAFPFQHAHGHVDASLAQHADAAAVDLCKGVAAACHHAGYALVDDE